MLLEGLFMYRDIKLLILFFLLGCIICGIAFAGGLSTKFVEAKLTGVKIGQSYSVEKVTGKALVVDNTTTDATLDIVVEPERPVKYNLSKGYEPIPDISWVKLEKNFFTGIGPGQSAKTDIIITIPTKKKYEGRKFQVYIYSHTKGGGTFSVGLMSRILIEIPRTGTQPRPGTTKGARRI